MLGLEYRIKDLEQSDKDVSLALAHEHLFDALKDYDTDLAASAITLQATLRKHGSLVQCTGKLAGHITLPCQRCLEPARIPIDVPLHMVFRPGSAGQAEASHREGPTSQGDDEDDDDDLDYAHHDGETVDLWPIVREDLILAVPITVLCKEDCQGLCPMCGIDRNTATCSCRPEAPKSPFARLSQVKLPS